MDLHVGNHVLNHEYQLQRREVVGVPGETREVLTMERQRSVGSLRGEHQFRLHAGYMLKVVAYGEVHFLPEATWYRDIDEPELAPSDYGQLAGIQLGLYQSSKANFVNLFLKIGSGLAAYDELVAPQTISLSMNSGGAEEVLAALAANYEVGRWGAMFGACWRRFRDWDERRWDTDDAVELSGALRLVAHWTEHFRLGFEVNGQSRYPEGISDESGEWENPMVWQVAMVPAWALKWGTFSRPELRLIVAASSLNESARLTYAAEEPERSLPVQYFAGMGVEWWFNSSRY